METTKRSSSILQETDAGKTVDMFIHSEEQESVQQNHKIYRFFGKRLFDIVFSICGLVVCAIPMVVIALIVRVTSPGSALFCQLRAGKKGKLFVLYKFRSMSVDAPEKSNQEFSHQAMDYYVTPFGKFMRKTSIDELPQLINVLRGEMSFIGPRPMAKTDAYVLKRRAELGADRIRPGISGLAQVNGRNEISDDQKARWDATYADDCSLKTDVKIIFRTFVEVFHQNGINKSEKK